METTTSIDKSKWNCSLASTKKLLRELGFHHSWGYWIHTNRRANRIQIEVSKHRIYLYMTESYNKYNHDKRIEISDKSTVDEVRYKIHNFYI